MARGQIIVETSELDKASAEVIELANTYKSNYASLFNKIYEMQQAWAGVDNTAYTNQIEGFRNDFEYMEKLMRDYADFLSQTASKYRATQADIQSKAKTLSTGM